MYPSNNDTFLIIVLSFSVCPDEKRSEEVYRERDVSQTQRLSNLSSKTYNGNVG